MKVWRELFFGIFRRVVEGEGGGVGEVGSGGAGGVVVVAGVVRRSSGGGGEGGEDFSHIVEGAEGEGARAKAPQEGGAGVERWWVGGALGGADGEGGERVVGCGGRWRRGGGRGWQSRPERHLKGSTYSGSTILEVSRAQFPSCTVLYMQTIFRTHHNF